MAVIKTLEFTDTRLSSDEIKQLIQEIFKDERFLEEARNLISTDRDG